MAAKKITCRNAFKHGLSTPWLPTLREEGQIEVVTRLLASVEADKDLLFVARTLARVICAEISTKKTRDGHLRIALERRLASRDERPIEERGGGSLLDEEESGDLLWLLLDDPSDLTNLDLYEGRRSRGLKSALRRFIASEADRIFTEVERELLDAEFQRHLEAGLDDPKNGRRFHLPRRPSIVPPCLRRRAAIKPGSKAKGPDGPTRTATPE